MPPSNSGQADKVSGRRKPRRFILKSFIKDRNTRCFTTKLKPIHCETISDSTKNPRLNVSDVARKPVTSQPAVSRRRAALEKEGLLDYTAVPNLKKLGFELLAFTFGKRKLDKYPDRHVEEMKKFIQKHPSMIFISTGSGMGSGGMGISIHKDYSLK